jgi:hypothetical protein
MPVDYYGFIYGDDATPAFDQPTFADLVQQEQGNAGDPSDGIDDLIAAIASDLDVIGGLIDVLATITALLDATGDPTADSVLADHTPLLENSLQAGSDQLQSLVAFALPLTGPINPTPIPGQPPPPSTAPSVCPADAVASLNLSATADGKDHSTAIQFSNNGSKALQLNPPTLDQGSLSIFSIDTSEGATVGAGKTVTIGTLHYSSDTTGAFTCAVTWVDASSGTRYPLCATVTFNALQGGSAGGSSGSGGDIRS